MTQLSQEDNKNMDCENKNNEKEPLKRDVLEGGIFTILFPGYGGAAKSIIIRLIVVIAIILLLIWLYKKYIKK